MTDINFTSTYRIPITQAGVNPAKKAKLKKFVKPYKNKLVSKNNTGTVRVSIPDKDDSSFIAKLKELGFKVFQKFEGEGIGKDKLDSYIKAQLGLGEYKQIGKHKRKLSNFAKQKRHSAILKKEKAEEEKLIAEVTEEVKKAKQAGKKVQYTDDFDRYDTNFNFEEFEIL